MNTITEVRLKKGVSKKTGKPWSGYEVTLDDGTIASGFELVRVGEQVSVVTQGKFTNYIKANGTDKVKVFTHGPRPETLDESKSIHSAMRKGAEEEDGVEATRKHLMRAANLLVLCIRATEKAIVPHQPVSAQNREQFQSDVAKLFIEASSRRTDDGVTWWSYVDRMPDHPIK